MSPIDFGGYLSSPSIFLLGDGNDARSWRSHTDQQHWYDDTLIRDAFAKSRSWWGKAAKYTKNAGIITNNSFLKHLGKSMNHVSRGLRVVDMGFSWREIDRDVTKGKYGPVQGGYGEELGDIQKALISIETGLSLIPFKYNCLGCSTVGNKHGITAATEGYMHHQSNINRATAEGVTDEDILNMDFMR